MMKWINCKDELPPLNEVVLVLDEYGGVMWSKQVPWINPPHQPSWKCLFQCFIPVYWARVEVPDDIVPSSWVR